MARELHDLFLQDSPLLSPMSMNSGHHPYSMLLALTATAVWLCYGLDGAKHSAPHFLKLPPPPLSAAPPLCALPQACSHTGSPPSACAPDSARGQGHSVWNQGTQGGPVLQAGPELWQAGLEAALPPSRAAMMHSTAEERLRHEQQQLLNGRGARAKADLAVKAQLAAEAEVAARTQSVQVSGWPAWAHVRMQEHVRPHCFPASVEEVRVCSKQGGKGAHAEVCQLSLRSPLMGSKLSRRACCIWFNFKSSELPCKAARACALEMV